MKTYNFHQLPQHIQDKIMELETNCDWEWYEDCLEQFKEEMQEKYGITIATQDIQFSGFSSQGDGASFTTEHGGISALKFVLNSDFDFDFERETYGLLEDMAVVRNLYEDVTEHFITLKVIRTSHQHSHENTVCGNVENDMMASDYDDCIDEEGSEKIHNFVEKLEEHFDSFIKEKCKELYRKLEEEHDSMFGHSTVLKRLELCKWDEDYNLID
jgi:hypothetical protein